jgi:hypothetical protein
MAKFKVTGVVDNIDIPEEDKNESPKGFKIKIDPKNIQDFLKGMKAGKMPVNLTPEESKRLAKELGIDEKDVSKVFKEITTFLEESVTEEKLETLEKTLSDSNGLISENEVDDMLLGLFGVDDFTFDDIEEEDDEDAYDTYNFSTLYDNDSFGVVKYIKAKDLYNLFIAKHGIEEKYRIEIFAPKVNIFNMIGSTNFDSIEYISHNDKYILFRLESDDDMEMPIIVALIIDPDTNDFSIIIPEYGNSFERDEEGIARFTKNQSRKPDMVKIKTGLDLNLYEFKKPALSVANFGRVILEDRIVTTSGNSIQIGRIKQHSEETEQIKYFKQDFNIREDITIFDFYIRINTQKTFTPQQLMAVGDYLKTIDFNANLAVNSIELQSHKLDNNDLLYIDLDLGDLPNHILEWIKE